MGIYDVVPQTEDFGIANARLYAPGDPDRSMISVRTKTRELGQMPPLGTKVVHEAATSVLDEWIARGLGFDIGDSDSEEF